METTDEVIRRLFEKPVFSRAYQIQIRTIESFHRLAERVAGAACGIGPLSESSLRPERNFFSTLFLAITQQVVGRSPYLPLYALVNQAMRAWVTACDNILDGEYKEVFPFALVGGAKVRSVLTLMIADRVLTEYVVENFDGRGLLPLVGRLSLSALIPSALQESEEEIRPVPVLPPATILEDIHVRKTGQLFEAPLALPLTLENVAPGLAKCARAAVRHFGLACQVLDDIKDMPDDLRAGRHNLLVSMLCEDPSAGRARLARLRQEEPTPWAAWERFPALCARAGSVATTCFARSFDAWAELGLPLDAHERSGIAEMMCELLQVTLPAAVLARGEG